MPDFNVRSDSVNVEQIMEQIRARIREKRGVDYTEQQIRELAAVKLEKFLDPKGVRSDLLDQFRKALPAYEPPELPNYAFEDATLFESHRAPIRWIRKLLLPILKLFFNPNPLIQAMHIQSRLNTMSAEREARREATRRQMDQLYYELIHNLVIETTRLGIEVKNLKMRLESVSSRLEFNERRARALESVVVYKPMGDEAPPARQQPAPQAAYNQPRQQSQQGRPPYAPPPAQTPPAVATVAPPAAGGAPGQAPAVHPSGGPQPQGPPGEGPGQRSRRRRRRRGRRGGGSATAMMGAPGLPAPVAAAPGSPSPPDAADQMDAMDSMEDEASDNEQTYQTTASDAQREREEAPAQAPAAAADVPEAPKTPPPPGSSDPDAQ